MKIINKAALDKWLRNHSHHALEPINSSSTPLLTGWLDLVTGETFTIQYGEENA